MQQIIIAEKVELNFLNTTSPLKKAKPNSLHIAQQTTSYINSLSLYY